MELEYKVNKIEDRKIPQIIRDIKIGDLIAVIAEEEDHFIFNGAGFVQGLQFNTEDSEAKYFISLEILKPIGEVKKYGTEPVPADKVTKYCIIKSTDDLDR